MVDRPGDRPSPVGPVETAAGASAEAGGSATIERLRAEIEELQGENAAMRDRLHLVGTAARVGIWEYDFARDQLWVSDELATIYGLEPDQLTWPDFVARLHPADRVSDLERPTPSYPFGQMNEFLIRVRHRDGGYRTIRSRSVTVGRDGVAARKLGAHIDMSEDALLTLNDELAEANERLRQFAYLASHDLRSPVRGIRQFVSFIGDHHAESLPPDVIEMLGHVEQRAGRLDRLVNDLLRFATSDLAEIGREWCDVDRLVDDIGQMVHPRGKRLAIGCQVGRRCQMAVSPFTVCLRNLIDNAAKHHHRETGLIDVSIALDGDWLVAIVTDDGPGMSELEQEKIFEPFYTTQGSEGSGIGLAHVRRTVDKYEAMLACASEVGVGTTFTLRWPVAVERPPRSADPVEGASLAVVC